MLVTKRISPILLENSKKGWDFWIPVLKNDIVNNVISYWCHFRQSLQSINVLALKYYIMLSSPRRGDDSTKGEEGSDINWKDQPINQSTTW